MTLEQGSKAPAFKANDQDGNPHSLKDYKGKKVALYFYPKDNTETCTKEACNLRDNFALLKAKGVVILGVSADDEKSHKKFEKKYSLTFPLLADTDKKIIEDYGVWRKEIYGQNLYGYLTDHFPDQ